jgi:chorismate synthase
MKSLRGFMASNSLGTLFRITTFGESRGERIGVVIDGCPPGVAISRKEIQRELDRRKPGRVFVSQRKEKDLCQIVSGHYQGKTTGAPLCILIPNEKRESGEDPSWIKPGHAAYSYLHKYGNFDPRGGGRASGRETALLVAAGSVAKKILRPAKVKILAYLSQMGEIQIKEKKISFVHLYSRVRKSPLFCPDPHAEKEMKEFLSNLKKEKESIGGVVSFFVDNMPSCLGDPLYEKLHANLAKALMSLPGARGFEIGEGFGSALMKGSKHNDGIGYDKGEFFLQSNHSGGVLGGISTGEPFVGKVAFKPASSIGKMQRSVDAKGEKREIFSSVETNDPCIAIRACPVVEAVIALVLVDRLLAHSALQISKNSSMFKKKKEKKS